MQKERGIVVEFKRILVPLDGSELAEKSLPYAQTLAQKFDAQLILCRILLIQLQNHTHPIYFGQGFDQRQIM